MKLRHKKRKRKTKLKNVNQLPGKIVYIGNRPEIATSFTALYYDKDTCVEKTGNRLSTVLEDWDNQKTLWLNITGLGDIPQMEEIGERFKIHPLALEDLVNTQQRAKFDEYETYLFIVLKSAYFQEEEYSLEHIGIILGENYVLTFQETDKNAFEKIKRRIEGGVGQARYRTTDYLLYTFGDFITDHYSYLVEGLGNQLENLESALLKGNADKDTVEDIQKLKGEIFQLRKIVNPLKEIAGQLEKSQHPLIHQKNFNYFRDFHDNANQVAEDIEMYREMVWGIMDMYISTLNNKMNEVMKVLTIVATIFIPLTFIAGVYGMNFENMPELTMKHGYLYVWIIMLVLMAGMIWYFKRKKWF